MRAGSRERSTAEAGQVPGNTSARGLRRLASVPSGHPVPLLNPVSAGLDLWASRVQAEERHDRREAHSGGSSWHLPGCAEAGVPGLHI